MRGKISDFSLRACCGPMCMYFLQGVPRRMTTGYHSVPSWAKKSAFFKGVHEKRAPVLLLELAESYIAECDHEVCLLSEPPRSRYFCIQ